MRASSMALIALLALAGLSPAAAELGGNGETIRQDAARETGTVASTTLGRYTVFTITTKEDPPQLTIREYLSDSGVVFGLAWQGARHPNTLRLLGAYAIAPGTPLRPGSVQQPRFSRRITDQVVLEAGGHIGDFWGRAYAPALLPDGLSPDVVK